MIIRKIVTACFLTLVPVTGFAQGIPVIDGANLAQSRANVVRVIAEAAKRLAEAKRLYDSVNGVTSMDEIAGLLNDSEVRELLGPDFMSVSNSLSGSLNDLGTLRQEAQRLADFTDVTLDEVIAQDFYQKEIERISNMTARDAAVGDRIVSVADDRLAGLDNLRQAISSASTQKEIDALNARIGVEMAMLQNDTNRILGLAMLQNAQEDLNLSRANKSRAQQIRSSRERAKDAFE